MKLRLIDPPLAVPRYRQVRLPTVAAEFTPYADVEINDENVEPVDFSPVDLVGFTAQLYNAPRAIHLARRFRAAGVKTIVGGPYATDVGEEALRHFDAVVVGEVEGLGGRIVGDLARGALRGVYRNEAPPDLGGRGLPRRDLQKRGAYYWINFPVEFTRGCPHRCSFCPSSLAYKTFRTRPLDDIARDLARRDHGLVEAVDLNFAADRRHALEVCELLAGTEVWGWFGEATLASLDDAELLRSLERSRCKGVFVGVESVDPAVLAGANKRFNKVADYARIVRRLEDHGILVHAGFIWGLDGARPDAFDATARFCEETGIYLASTNLATYFPGTPDHERMRRAGRIEIGDLREYDGIRVTVPPVGMTAEEVYAGARRFVDRFYGLRSIFRRSFQSACYNFAQLYDFWGMNLVYRAFFKAWARNLGRRDPPWPAATAEERDTFPFVGGRMPFISAVGDREGRVFEAGYRAWTAPPEPLSPAAALIPAAVAACGAAAALAAAQAQAGAHWPLPFPGVGLALAAFVVAAWVGAWLVTRLARVRDGGAGARLTTFAGLGLATAPLGLATVALPAHAGVWRYLCALLAALFWAKGASVLASARAGRKSPLRVASFLLLFPTLDFDGAFALDGTKAFLGRHVPLFLRGAARSLGGVALSAALGYAAIRGWLDGPLAPAGHVGRLVAFYLLVRGPLECLTAYWRMVGCVVPDPVAPRLLEPDGPAALWRGFDVPWHDWLRRHVYVPLGGKRRPVRAVLGAFAASGLLAAAALAPVVHRFPLELVLFFAAEGAVVAIEKSLAPAGERARARGLLLHAAAAAIFFAAAPWIFAVTDRIFT